MQTPATTLESFLRQNELHHITPLKVLGLFGSQLRSVPLRVAGETAYLLWSRRDASLDDCAKCPTADAVFVRLWSKRTSPLRRRNLKSRETCAAFTLLRG
jgi:hypothetical protein